jgi:hypothetical protein
MIEEPNIVEEGGFVLSPAASKHDHDSDSFSDEDLRDDEETGLTSDEKKKKQKKKRRNTLLDQRIAREKNLSPEEQKEADKSVIKRIAINMCLILLWYFFSLSISLVSPTRALPSQSRTCRLTRAAVQQMDVRRGPPQFRVPALHNFHAHGCPVRALRHGALLCATTTATVIIP